MENGLRKIVKLSSFFILHFSFSLCLTGCFKEPQPAIETVPAETQVYLKDKGLETLTIEAIQKDGLVFVDERAGLDTKARYEMEREGRVSDAGGYYTNLSARVATFVPNSLTYLNLDYNHLSNIDVITAFTGLKWLRLNENRLQKLPDLAALENLQALYLRGNALTDEALAETFRADVMPKLDRVDLSGNPITVVPPGLAERKGLSHLNLSNTKIRELPEDLSPWQSLKSLQLGGLDRMSGEEMTRIRTTLSETAVVF